MRTGREFLISELGAEIQDTVWWPQAQSVMAWWLQKLSQDYFAWDADRRKDPEDPDWIAMAKELARVVGAEADRLGSDGQQVTWIPDTAIALAVTAGEKSGKAVDC